MQINDHRLHIESFLIVRQKWHSTTESLPQKSFIITFPHVVNGKALSFLVRLQRRPSFRNLQGIIWTVGAKLDATIVDQTKACR